MGRPKIWINAGEPSGDMHGATLIKALGDVDPAYEFVGIGGEEMKAAGMTPDFSVEDLSLVGIVEVLGALGRIARMLWRIGRLLDAYRPRAVVLIDAPDFNFFVARMAHKRGIPVYYYITPQVWAWRQGRVKFLARRVDRLLCILPFEAEFFRRHGLHADFVGHPLKDRMPLEELDRVPMEPDLVGILPGSRNSEVAALLPVMAEAARRLHRRHPNLRFSMIRAGHIQEQRLRQAWPEGVPLEIHGPEDRYRQMRRMNFCFAASGTVTLELALLGTPALVAYRLSGFTAWVVKNMAKVNCASLPNLILNYELLPELIQELAEPGTMSRLGAAWLENPGALEDLRRGMRRVRSMLSGRAGENAARIIHEDLARRPKAAPAGG